MHDDHEGQRVSRRSMVRGVSALGFGAVLAACAREGGGGTGAGATASAGASTGADLTGLFAKAGTCKLTPTTTQGPYYFDADNVRSDIRENKPGTRLRVAIKLQDSESCQPLPNAVVEIWHCDASGQYSGAEAKPNRPGGSAPPSGPGGTPPSGGPVGSGGPGGGQMGDLTPTDERRYLRGAQVTNADGIVQFTTVWPGWYRGRTVHIHAMVHVTNERVLTTQMMFDEKLNTKIFAAAPYASHLGRDTLNDKDTIFKDTMLMRVTEDSEGYLGVIVLAADADRDGA